MSVPVAETRRTFPKSVQPGIPKIKVPLEGAKRYTFRDLFEVVQRPVKLDDATIYDLVTVKRARGGIEHRARMRGSQIAVKSQFYLDEKDFLISKRQIVHGACGIVSKDFSGSIVSNEYSVLRCKPEIDIQYLGYLSHSIYFQQTCFHSSIGVHIEKMIFKLGDWFKWPINLPSLPEQKKIAGFLGVVDAKIAALRDRVAGLERYKRGLMQALFSQTLRFTKPNGTPFPNWEEKRLGEVAKIYDGTHQTPNYVTEGVPFFSVEQVTANNFDRTKFIAESVFEKESKRVVLERDDILMTRIGDIGTCRLIDWDVRASFYVSLALVKCATSVNSSYLCQFMNSECFQRELWKRTIHVAFPKKINLGEIGNCLLRLPHPEEQAKIAEALSAMDAKIAAVTGQLEKMQDFKKGLLQQMFV